MTNPRSLSRFGGAMYLLIIVLGVFEELFVRNRIIVSGNATQTAANLQSMEFLWRLGIASEFVLLTSAVVLTAIFFVLLRPVSEFLALTATYLNLVSVAVEVGVGLNLVQALFPLGKAEYLSAFTPEQRDALASMAIRSHAIGFGVALIFFGWTALLLGYLIIRSGYMPRPIGVLMQIAGICYLINSFVLLLWPALANRLFPTILLPSFVGELSFALWLLLRGVSLEAWNRRVPAPASFPRLVPRE